MQSILVSKEDLFVFHFYDTYLEIERKGELTKKIGYEKVKSCELIKGKPQILATIFVGFVSLFTGMLRDIKIYKEHDQLLIELKNKTTLSYQIYRSIDDNIVIKIIDIIKQKAI
jgi:hypothetical protein|tara:strand:- start:199 stop:540 length:342 start_codon:yes stop_codon:yes gene_type:complete